MFENRRVCIIGMGYVGLTLGIALASRGVNVTGVEINEAILTSLKSGEAHFKEAGINDALQSCLMKGQIDFTDKLPNSSYNFIIITVGTPLDDDGNVNFDGLNKAIDSLPYFQLAQETVVVLRSTVAVGSSKALFEKFRSKGIENISFAPERTIEGNALQELYSLPQIVGANNSHALERTSELFSIMTDKIVKVSSLEIAELAKLFNNTYRDITFAVGNYFSLVAQQFGSNGIEAINAANLDYPRGGIPSPGLVGGPCLEKDPYILSYPKYITHNIPLLHQFNFTTMSRTFNESLITSFSELIIKHSNGTPIVVSGLAFKGRPATSDLRGSMGMRLFKTTRTRL